MEEEILLVEVLLVHLVAMAVEELVAALKVAEVLVRLTREVAEVEVLKITHQDFLEALALSY